jgi:ribosome-associated toxin RatA of RatAB toxin-antitoxin module
MGEQVSVSREIAASPEQLYEMVADVTRMGEWSPECEGGTWLGDATGPAPGAKFRATNRVGKRSWKTVSTVTTADPGRHFSFVVTAGPMKAAAWTYSFQPAANGCLVTESWDDLRPGWFKKVTGLATGVRDRPDHNRTGMEQTLANLAQSAESSGQPGG